VILGLLLRLLHRPLGLFPLLDLLLRLHLRMFLFLPVPNLDSERFILLPTRLPSRLATSSNLFELEKFDASGNFIKLKARLVAGGHRVDRSLYHSLDETSAPTARFESVTLLSAASFHNPIMGVFDVAAAFSKFRRADGSMVVQMEGGLYGLPESGNLIINFISLPPFCSSLLSLTAQP
jgi:hypothetical protein